MERCRVTEERKLLKTYKERYNKRKLTEECRQRKFNEFKIKNVDIVGQDRNCIIKSRL